MRISVVLPVYGVEEYLPHCLDSVLGQPLPDGTELEVIAVDDRSPDGSGAILDDYAARDPRLRVLHLERNRGLGGAREAGLAEASGEYVWFVDSDDWLADGALTAVAERLTAVRPDVLITDFIRSYPGGGTEPNTWRGLMTQPPLPETFTLDDRPGLLQMIMSVWNKVLRRDFLLGLGVRFGAGYYEDISVTYPVLLAAERISYLDLPCYFYRREREGAITHTASPKHADAFAQYDRIFDFLDAHGVDGRTRRLVFDRTVKQAVTIHDTPGLVPAELRREFFHRISEHFRRHRPPGYRYPSGPRGAQYRLLDRDAYAVYERLRRADRLRRAARALPYRARRKARGAARLAYYQACLRLPMDDHLAVYAAYWYRGYACNPAAIYAKARELAPSVRGVWVVRDRERAAALPPGVPYVIENTPAYFRAMATAKYLVNNVNFPHATPKRPGSVHVQTQHGTPLKMMGLDLRDRPEAAQGMDFERLREHIARWDYLVSPNPHTTETFTRAFPGRYEVLETGYPRNDRLATADPDDRAGVRERLGIPDDQTVILYAPTHREGQRAYVPALDLAAFAEALGPGHTLLVRAHYFYAEGVGELPGAPGAPDATGAPGAGAADRARVLDVSGHSCVEDLCLASDLLISDYSSLIFDYAALDRPIVVHAPDWDEYRRVRGVYFDITTEPPGVVTRDQDELVRAVRDGAASGPEAARRRAAFRARFCPYDDGQAAERVVRRIFRLDGA